MPIQILPDELASQIAAGEVIERPASVVKELVENALDAGASHISIEILEAGKKLIEVSDNGSGIPSTELELAVSRHATSKLQAADDLFSIGTLGFRGEALASVGSVSRMTLTSRQADADEGARVVVEGGKLLKLEKAGVPAGSVARVEDLFFNVPARLKFLKSDVTERRQIDQFVTRYALAYPHVRFELRQEERVALQTSGSGDRREVLAALYNAEIARQMLEVDMAEDGLTIKGFVSPTSVTRANRSAIDFFVNGRWVKDIALTTALVQAYHTLLMVGRYPIGILFIEVPPDKVDVNVHPAKAEVRFIDADTAFSGVQRAARRALLAFTPVPSINTQLNVRWQPQPKAELAAVGRSWGSEADEDTHDPDQPPNDTTDPTIPSEQVSADPIRSGIPLLRLVGQVGTAFLVAEGPDGLYLVDQHAAHERVLFEKFMAQRTGDVPAQRLLEAVTIELPSEQSRLLEAQLPTLSKLGFEVDAFGPNSYKIRAIPALLTGADPVAALQVLIEDFEEDETPLQDEVEARIIARVCKRAAVKAGQTLSPDEQKALLNDLEQCQAPRTCPHGRPTMIHLSIDLLERQFGRRGAR